MTDTEAPPGAQGSETDGPGIGAPKESVPDDEATRRCGHCGEEFSYQRAASRPPKYCSRVWPEAPRTCQARAKAQRVAQKAVGLDGSIAAYRQAGDAVTPAIAGLQETLAGLVTQTQKVEAAALARMADAERDAQDAANRAEAADVARDRAERAQAHAERSSADAVRAARDAEQRAHQAEQDRDAKLRQAWEQVTDKEGERAAAVARAEEHTAAATRAEDLRRAAHQRAETLAAANEELQQRLTETRARAERHVAKAHADVTAAREALVQAQTRHVRQVDRLRDDTAEEARRLRAEHDAAQEVVAGLRTELAAAHQRVEAESQELRAAETAVQAATQRADTADHRYDQLITALSHRNDPAPPS